MVIFEVVLKLTADSAGIVSSLLPVNAAPAVPAPAPTRPPMRAPFPPPARPPIRAPAPAPPPIKTAERLPLPFFVTTYSSVATLWGTPLMFTEVSRMARIASPLNLPADLASDTTPLTPEPAGTTTLPFDAIPLANVPVKGCPSCALFEESVSPMRTVMFVPAGMTIGGGGGGGGGACSCATGAAAGTCAGVVVAGVVASLGGCAGGVCAGAVACCASCPVDAGGVCVACSFLLHPARPRTSNAPSKTVAI